MKAIISIPFAIAISSFIASPAAAQYSNDYYNNYNRYQMQQQRQRGWGSGSYFGQPYPNQPSLQQNIRYQRNSCATNIYC
jgi:type II secretory pathway pseudopilin PulG|tara:strand:- start:127 stop:366 length:240 start_codon:yes stop_codon:yes gene_type:complete